MRREFIINKKVLVFAKLCFTYLPPGVTFKIQNVTRDGIRLVSSIGIKKIRPTSIITLGFFVLRIWEDANDAFLGRQTNESLSNTSSTITMKEHKTMNYVNKSNKQNCSFRREQIFALWTNYWAMWVKATLIKITHMSMHRQVI